MAQKLTASFPPALTLTSGYSLRFRAVDPFTGADVAGVVITNAAVFVDDLAADSETPPEAAMPVLVPTEV